MPTQTLTYDEKDLNEIIRLHLLKEGLEPTAPVSVTVTQPDRAYGSADVRIRVSVQPVKRPSPPANLLDPRNGY
ncbi:hypothetical protein LJ737_20820 [Hymenobacter sp. 15J16-1T3B]|uniref:hypothetical protein n=1 Tax=Hymenobacter sp. 15J16-1T3B TaxID=2886941 RepID=UPI001D114094|nr:hypothetical protein [Hymenobacter sp. 15J16-1T3B]MCC3159697.1 hypothetical protein [Hymenobacter sp. 15J16-1T3B]